MTITRDQAPGGVSDATDPYASATATTTSAVELLLSYIVTLTNSGTETLTPGNSFAIVDQSNNANDACTGASLSRAVTSTGSYNSSTSSTGAGTSGAVVFIVTYAGTGIAQGQHTLAEALVSTSPNTAVGPTPSKTTTTGSAFSVFVGWYGGAAAPTSVTDSKGNTYTQVGATASFAGDPNLKGALYESINGTGGSGHTWSAAFATGQLCITLFAVEMTDGGGTPPAINSLFFGSGTTG